jgi:flavin-dependent dehydrogenase
LILDQQQFPREKLCAGWITPQVVSDLALAAEDYPGGLTMYRALWISIWGVQFRLPTQQYAIRRCEFDDWLLRRSGVPVQTHRVRQIERRSGVYVVDGAFVGKYLVGAGGTRCPVYRTLFQEASPRDRDSLIVTLEQEFQYAHTDSRCQLWFVENGLPGYAWYVPKADGVVNVGIGAKLSPMHARGSTLRRHWRDFVDKLDRHGLVRGHLYQPRGHVYYTRQREPRVRLGNALIVGDAVGLATLNMGEGIGPAVRSGLLAAEAIVRDSDYDIRSISRLSLLPSLRYRARQRL